MHALNAVARSIIYCTQCSCSHHYLLHSTQLLTCVALDVLACTCTLIICCTQYFSSYTVLSAVAIVFSYTKDGCLDGWSSVGDMCFTVVQDAVNFEEAANACIYKSSNLASIWTKGEWDFVHKLMVCMYY